MEIVNLIEVILKLSSFGARNLASLLGKINSCKKSHGNICNIMLRRTQHVLGKYVNEFGWDTKVKLNDHVKKELLFFKEYIFNYNGSFISVTKTPLKVITFQEKIKQFSVDEKF